MLNFSNNEIIAFIILLSGAFTIIILERIFPYNKQKFFRDGFFTDFLFYNFIQSAVLGWVIFKFINFIDGTGLFDNLKFMSQLPLLAQLIFFIVTHDFYIYLFHKAQHHNKYLWKLHEAHHSVKEVDWLAGVRSHPFEILINQTVEFAPIILLGASSEVALYKGVVSGLWGMYIHSNINVRSGVLQYVINGPEMHRWHHELKDSKAYNKNFSTKLAIWDWIFGTAYLPKFKKAQTYGLDNPDYPNNYIGQILYIFKL